MTWGELGANALQLVFILLIFWGIMMRLNRIERSIEEINKRLSS